MSNGGKGSRPRPYSIPLDQYGKNFDAIFRKLDPIVLEDAQAEDEAFKTIDMFQKINYNNLDKNKG